MHTHINQKPSLLATLCSSHSLSFSFCCFNLNFSKSSICDIVAELATHHKHDGRKRLEIIIYVSTWNTYFGFNGLCVDTRPLSLSLGTFFLEFFCGDSEADFGCDVLRDTTSVRNLGEVQPLSVKARRKLNQRRTRSMWIALRERASIWRVHHYRATTSTNVGYRRSNSVRHAHYRRHARTHIQSLARARFIFGN